MTRFSPAFGHQRPEQTCSNRAATRVRLLKYWEKSIRQKYVYLQQICNLQKPVANYHTAFTRPRTLVRTQHRPLDKSRALQRKRQPEVWARTSYWPYLQQ